MCVCLCFQKRIKRRWWRKKNYPAMTQWIICVCVCVFVYIAKIFFAKKEEEETTNSFGTTTMFLFSLEKPKKWTKSFFSSRFQVDPKHFRVDNITSTIDHQWKERERANTLLMHTMNVDHVCEKKKWNAMMMTKIMKLLKKRTIQ